MKKLILIAALSWFPAHATTWYVDNSCAVNGNGSSTSCGANGPWNSLPNVTCAGVSAGDHIQIRHGKGKYQENSGGTWSMQPPPACNGTGAIGSSNPNYVYLENFPGEDVIVDGSLDIHTSTWSAVGGGVYSCTGGTCLPAASNGWAWIAWYVPAGGGVEQEIYTLQQVGGVGYASYSCDATVPAGFMRLTFNRQVCVHLPGDANPGSAQSFSIPYVTYGMFLGNPPYSTSSNFYVRHNPSGGSFVVQRHYFDNVTMDAATNFNVVIDGLDVGFSINRCIDVQNNPNSAFTDILAYPQNNAFIHNHIHHCGQEGIHMGADNAWPAVFSFNEVDHIQIPPWFQHTGSDSLNGPRLTDRGVGVRIWCAKAPNANPAGCYVANNIIHDSGGGAANGKHGAVNFEYGAQNVLMENNLIYNIGPLGTSKIAAASGGLGVQISPNFAGDPTCNPCTFRNNRIYNVDTCFETESTWGGYLINIVNNTCANFSESFLGSEYGVTTGVVNIVNNIIYWSSTAGISSGPTSGMLSSTTANGGSFSVTGAFSNNAFYCATGCNGNVVTWLGSNYQAGTIGTSGNNTWGDPLLSLAPTQLPFDRSGTTGGSGSFAPWNAYKMPAPSLFLTAGSGTAYQHGLALAPAFPDALGLARPSSGAWDVGAVSFDASRNATIPPPNVTVH
jgi:hypothetical protein